MDFINSPQPSHWHCCPKYLFPPYFHGISPDFQSIFTADPTNRDILKGCRLLPQSGDLLRWVDNREENRNRPLEGQTLTQPQPFKQNFFFGFVGLKLVCAILNKSSGDHLDPSTRTSPLNQINHEIYDHCEISICII